MAAANMELMVDGNKYSVGDSMLVTDGRTRTDASGTTGKLPGTASTGRWLVSAITGAWSRNHSAITPTSNAPTYRQHTVTHPTTIGSIYDSADDKARLLLLDKYLGWDRMNVAVDIAGTRTATNVSASNPRGTIASFGGQTISPLTPYGQFLMIRDVPGTGFGSLNATDRTPERNRKLQQVYTFTGNTGTTVNRYFVREESATRNATTGAVTSYVYKNVDPLADHDGDGVAANEVKIAPRIPLAKPFDHLNVGVWVDLDKVGGNSQTPASMGVGFVQKTEKGMRTGSDMPNFGSARYLGRGGAHLRAASATGNGTINLISFDVDVTANFGSGGINVTLDNLAKLTGKIENDSFAGTTVAPYDNPTGPPPFLPQTGSYTGSFKGHFYGPRAAEAGGVFDFTSAGRKDGEFRGAFGVSQNGFPGNRRPELSGT